ncbi:MAG: hypothetical protein WC178_05280 [Candidatus Paceibacterota bacterium]
MKDPCLENDSGRIYRNDLRDYYGSTPESHSVLNKCFNPWK